MAIRTGGALEIGRGEKASDRRLARRAKRGEWERLGERNGENEREISLFFSSGERKVPSIQKPEFRLLLLGQIEAAVQAVPKFAAERSLCAAEQRHLLFSAL